jgi:pre-mRNA-processing factor SLU7
VTNLNSDGKFLCFHRNLCFREDTTKYLLNPDVNSTYYDPKTRSMREDPLPDVDPK